MECVVECRGGSCWKCVDGVDLGREHEIKDWKAIEAMIMRSRLEMRNGNEKLPDIQDGWILMKTS